MVLISGRSVSVELTEEKAGFEGILLILSFVGASVASMK